MEAQRDVDSVSTRQPFRQNTRRKSKNHHRETDANYENEFGSESRKAFTLIEMIGVIAILASLQIVNPIAPGAAVCGSNAGFDLDGSGGETKRAV